MGSRETVQQWLACQQANQPHVAAIDQLVQQARDAGARSGGLSHGATLGIAAVEQCTIAHAMVTQASERALASDEAAAFVEVEKALPRFELATLTCRSAAFSMRAGADLEGTGPLTHAERLIVDAAERAYRLWVQSQCPTVDPAGLGIASAEPERARSN